MLKKILYADAGTGNSQEMFQVLMDLPTIQNAKITILHVVSEQISAEAVATKWEDGGKMLADLIQKLNLDTNLVTTMLRQGEPKDTVCEVAKKSMRT